eukprot:CAMPEP_0194143972 /NCGR_PEP_ID=MMETSP0152-20130528/13070_1 /TAXON_ID=1049557 /ORGANISM="Thalassiothrix antarctica, Strain L6-D1" /LENGTH=87 /DNA_ID=CAMNT_0038843621 /DNA_START=228 /DNA_END=488 /DNA_ORIENTATION=+
MSGRVGQNGGRPDCPPVLGTMESSKFLLGNEKGGSQRQLHNKSNFLHAYENRDKNGKVDVPSSELAQQQLQSPEFKGSLDNKKIKYR